MKNSQNQNFWFKKKKRAASALNSNSQIFDREKEIFSLKSHRFIWMTSPWPDHLLSLYVAAFEDSHWTLTTFWQHAVAFFACENETGGQSLSVGTFWSSTEGEEETKLFRSWKLKRENNHSTLHANRRGVMVSQLALGSGANCLFMSRRPFKSKNEKRGESE